MTRRLSQGHYDARRQAWREDPTQALHCCDDHAGTACTNNATHWVLRRQGRWDVVDTLPAGLPEIPPTFCQQHADMVCERCTAKTQPAPAPLLLAPRTASRRHA
jgi:hypothetical protein